MKHNPQDKKVKIAMLGHKSIPSRQGGIEIVVEELAVRMAALGHQVTIYNRIDECASVVEDKALIFKKSDVNDLKEKLQLACDQPKIVEQMKAEAADFICGKYNWDDVVKETLSLYRK